MKDNTTITISRDTARKLKITKIESDAKDMDQVVRDLIDRKSNPQITLRKNHINIKSIENEQQIDFKELKELVELDEVNDGESNGNRT
jgi:hypothetical protein